MNIKLVDLLKENALQQAATLDKKGLMLIDSGQGRLLGKIKSPSKG